MWLPDFWYVSYETKDGEKRRTPILNSWANAEMEKRYYLRMEYVNVKVCPLL